jgi:predicted ATPase
MEAEIQRVDAEMTNASDYARGLAKMPYARELADLRQRYGADLDHYSHGESFLKFFSARLRPGGLHLLDEPEAPLSPTRQLTLLAMLKEMVGQGAQFIVATHSPILMAYPDAAIYSFDYTPARRVAYEDLEHVTLLRTFLNDPSQFLKRM